MPTLQWTIPNGYTPGAESIYIYDKTNPTPNGQARLIYSKNNIGTATNPIPLTYTIPSGALPANLPNEKYMISIQLDQTNPNLLSPENIEGRSRTFVNFNLGRLTTPVYVPVITSDGAYQFDIAVKTGQRYAIDPAITAGFRYATGTGNPNIATVLLPDLQGSDPYTISWDNGLDMAHLLGGDVFNFLLTDPLGVSAFTVTGIDPTAGVDPSSGTAFVTSLTFVGDGSFTGTMTPIANVQEPWSLALLGTGLAGAALIRRRHGHAEADTSTAR